MEILETLLTLVVTIVFIKFCLWFAETVEQEIEDARPSPKGRRRCAQPKSTKTAPTKDLPSKVEKTFASSSTQTDGAEYEDVGSQTTINGTEIAKLQAQAAATKWQAIVVRKRRIDLQKLEQKVRVDAADLNERRQNYKGRIDKLYTDLLKSKEIREQLDIASDIQKQRADAAEARLQRHVEAAAAASSTRTQATRSCSTQTDDTASKKVAEEHTAMQGRLDRLQLALSKAEQEGDTERSRADRERKRADEHEAKNTAGTATLSELETARKAQSDAEAERKKAEEKLSETEVAADDVETARQAAKKRADYLQGKLDEARDTIKENRKSAKDSTENAERERQQVATQLENAIKERDAAIAGRSQGSNSGGQATSEHSSVLQERDAAVTKQNQALEQLDSTSKERDEANRVVGLAKIDWEKMRGERDQALRDREAAATTVNAAASREKELWDEGCRIFQLLTKAEATEQEVKRSAEQTREQLNRANSEIEQLKQMVGRLNQGLPATQNNQVNGHGGFQQTQAMDFQSSQGSATHPFASSMPSSMPFGSGQQSQQLPHIAEESMSDPQSQPMPPSFAPGYQFGATMPDAPEPPDAQAMLEQVEAEKRARNEANQQPQPNADVDMESTVTDEPSKGSAPMPQTCPKCDRRMSGGNCMRLGCGAPPVSSAPKADEAPTEPDNSGGFSPPQPDLTEAAPQPAQRRRRQPERAPREKLVPKLRKVKYTCTNCRRDFESGTGQCTFCATPVTGDTTVPKVISTHTCGECSRNFESDTNQCPFCTPVPGADAEEDPDLQ